MEHIRAVPEVVSCSRGGKAIDLTEFHEDVEGGLKQLAALGEGGAWDDVTGMPLDRKKVQQARREELEYVRSKKFWTKIPRAEAQRRGIKVIKTRWVDINKGDDANPEYCSRFVAKVMLPGPSSRRRCEGRYALRSPKKTGQRQIVTRTWFGCST